MRYVEELRVQTGFLMHVVDCMAHQEGNDLLLLDSTTPATSTTIATTAATTSLLHTHHTTEAVNVPNWLPRERIGDSLQCSLPPVTTLISLHYQGEITACQYFRQFTYPTTSGLFQLTWLLVLNQSSLTYVRLHDCDIHAPLDVIILAHALSNLPSLKDLDLKFKTCLVRWKHVVRTLFYNLPVSIEALSLDSARNITVASRISSRANHPETGLPLTKRNRPLLRLKRLRILFGRWEDTRLLTAFVEDCPALESFTPPLFGNSGARLILMVLAPAIVRHCPQLRNLDSCGLGSITIINTMPHHTLHSIGDGGHCMRWDVHAIMMRISTTQFSSLREIQIEKCAHVKGSAIQAVLWSCVALEVLVVRGGSAAATRLKHLVEREWTCTRLKRLEITVDLQRVETPAFVLAQTGRKMLTANNEMWEMLRRFYRQLGALSEIEVLNLRIKSKEMKWLDEHGRVVEHDESEDYGIGGEQEEDEDSDNWSVEDDFEKWVCTDLKKLSMTNADASFPGLLSMGDSKTNRPGYLSYLAGLSKLQELRGHVQATTTETSVTFGQREVEWMVLRWPQLKVIELLPEGSNMSSVASHILWLQERQPTLCVTKEALTQ